MKRKSSWFEKAHIFNSVFLAVVFEDEKAETNDTLFVCRGGQGRKQLKGVCVFWWLFDQESVPKSITFNECYWKRCNVFYVLSPRVKSSSPTLECPLRSRPPLGSGSRSSAHPIGWPPRWRRSSVRVVTTTCVIFGQLESRPLSWPNCSPRCLTCTRWERSFSCPNRGTNRQR